MFTTTKCIHISLFKYECGKVLNEIHYYYLLCDTNEIYVALFLSVFSCQFGKMHYCPWVTVRMSVYSYILFLVRFKTINDRRDKKKINFEESIWKEKERKTRKNLEKDFCENKKMRSSHNFFTRQLSPLLWIIF